MLSKYLVVAHNWHVAREFARHKGWRNGEWLYISVPEKLIGMSNREVYVVDEPNNWWNYEVLDQLYWSIQTGRINPIYITYDFSVHPDQSIEPRLEVLLWAVDIVRKLRLAKATENANL